MPGLELVLVDWPDPPDFYGPKLLGRLRDADLVDAARDRLAASHLRSLSALRSPVQTAQPPEGGDGAA